MPIISRQFVKKLVISVCSKGFVGGYLCQILDQSRDKKMYFFSRDDTAG